MEGFVDPVTYRVDITHWHDGDLQTTVNVFEAGDSEEDRRSIAYALRHAADLVENGVSLRKGQMS